MQTDITRQLSASVYFNQNLRKYIIDILKDPYHNIVQPPGIDFQVLAAHALNARRLYRSFLVVIFVITFLIFVTLPFSGLSGFLLTFILLLILFIVVWAREERLESVMRKDFSRHQFSAASFQYDGPDKELVSGAAGRMCKNVMFYSNFYPFVGGGVDIGGWSFVLNLDKGKNIFGKIATPQSFLEDELYYRVAQELLSLKIPGMTIENKVYFDGKKIRDQRNILPHILSHPITEVTPEFVKKAMICAVPEVRYYKMIQIVDWEGDLILSAYLRFQSNDKTLFAECSYFLLPPIKEGFKVVDKLKTLTGFRKYAKRFAVVVAGCIVYPIVSAFRALGLINHVTAEVLGQSEEQRMKKEVETSPDYDYGSKTTVREAVGQNNYYQLFQKLDKERYVKMIDKRIFNSLEEFLDSKDIDTSEFKERETRILNNGLMIAGSNFQAENISIGDGSSINFRLPKLSKSKTEK